MSKIKTILIVEDEAINFEYLYEILTPLNYHLIHAKNGLEAIEQCKENYAINLVLMDIRLPLLNGYQATQKIKEFRPDLPIIAQTAYGMLSDREKALEAGCDNYISKPIKKKTLLTLINSY